VQLEAGLRLIVIVDERQMKTNYTEESSDLKKLREGDFSELQNRVRWN